MKTSQPRIHFAISSHGYGHLTQSIAVLRALIRRYPKLTVSIQCNLPRSVIADRLGNHPFEHDQRSLDVGMVQIDPLTADLEASAIAYADLHHNFEKRVVQEATRLQAWKADLVIADIPYLPIAAAAHAGIPSVAIASLSWDYIIESYFDTEQPEPKQWLQECRMAYNQTTLALLPEPAMEGACFPNKQFIPPIAIIGERKAELRSILGISKDDRRPLILFSLGGIPGSQLPLTMMEKASEFHWLVREELLPQKENIHSFEQMSNWQYKDIIASVDGVVSKPGYGTAVEVVALGIPFVFTRRGDFPDESVTIEWLNRHGRVTEITKEEWKNGAFVDRLRKLMETPKAPAYSCHGADIAAQVIEQMFLK